MGHWINIYGNLDKHLIKIPFINPDRLSHLGVILSVFYFYLHSSPYRFILLLLIVFLDYLDGVMARKIGKKDEFIDVACDRTSELIIFSSLRGWSLLIVIINIWLSIWKLKRNIHAPIILPLRHILLGYTFLGLII